LLLLLHFVVALAFVVVFAFVVVIPARNLHLSLLLFVFL